ncbi:MAG TPA: PfkB family carbohydrate kinase [Desulfobacterales bacterium]|nr:PfkB family carbohydrate kinase [Desulfobacterales bacterium]
MSVDVLGLGAVAVDDLFYLDEYPRPDTKVRVVRRERHAGGLTGTALVAAARMGRRCAYAGALGGDELSRFIIDGLAAERVDTGLVVTRTDARPFHSTILVDMKGLTRTILSDATGVIGADPSGPDGSAIASARVLFVDHVGLAGMVRAARIARAAGIPVVADFERRCDAPFDELLALVDHPVVPLEFAREVTGAADGVSAVRALWHEGRSAVVVTDGTNGSWHASREAPGRVFHQPAFRVGTVDTNGCGDVFHGCYAAGLCEGMPMDRRVRFAAAAAAVKATQRGGQKGIPSRAEAERFLAERAAEAPSREVA